MAKVEQGLVNVRGKYGDDIIVKGSRKKAHTRKPVKAGSKKNEAALKRQYKRAAYINRFASEINTVVKNYSGGLRTASFYQHLLGLFRKATIDNRYLLLLQLKGTDTHPGYPFSRFDVPQASCEATKTSIVVKQQVLIHPTEEKHSSNCYYFEPFLLQWRKGNGAPEVSSQLSEWISTSGGLPEFEFRFPKIPGLQQWLLMMRLRLGQDNKAIEFKATEAMQIMEAGTVVKSDLVLARKLNKVDVTSSPVAKKNIEEPVRVKAKRFV